MKNKFRWHLAFGLFLAEMNCDFEIRCFHNIFHLRFLQTNMTCNLEILSLQNLTFVIRPAPHFCISRAAISTEEPIFWFGGVPVPCSLPFVVFALHVKPQKVRNVRKGPG